MQKDGSNALATGHKRLQRPRSNGCQSHRQSCNTRAGMSGFVGWFWQRLHIRSMRVLGPGHDSLFIDAAMAIWTRT